MPRRTQILPPGVMWPVEYARHRGVAASTITRAIQRGDLAAPAVRQDGSIDVARADAMLGPSTKQLAIGQTDVGQVASPSAPLPEEGASLPAARGSARDRLQRAQAEKAELETALKKGDLVDRAVAEAAIEDLARQLRDRVLGVGREVAADCARLADEHAIEGRITLALRAALNGLHLELTRDHGMGGAA